jgi:hypothetical protein
MGVAKFLNRLLARKRVVALGVALVFVALIGFPLRPYINAAFNPPLNNDVDLSALFKNTPDKTLDAGDFVDLRDPACTKSFSLRLAQPVFIRISRNCTYSIFVDDGRARANFLNATKGAVELAPGRSWSARDFWSLIPLTSEAYVRLEPTP